MTFKKFLLGYTVFWVVLIVGVCFWEWSSLKSFQADYEVEADNDVPSILDGNVVVSGETTVAVPEVVAKAYEFIADNSMIFMVNGVAVQPQLMEEFEDIIYEDYFELTGRQIVTGRYVLELLPEDELVVTDVSGNVISPVDNNYIAGTFVENSELADVAISKVEFYLKHVNGLVEFNQMSYIMRPESKAYKAVRNSQESLKWIVKATKIGYNKEITERMQILDEQHFVCDVNIDLTKKANSSSGREYIVDESVSYRVLFENVNGTWYIYSFQTK